MTLDDDTACNAAFTLAPVNQTITFGTPGQQDAAPVACHRQRHGVLASPGDLQRHDARCLLIRRNERSHDRAARGRDLHRAGRSGGQRQLQPGALGQPKLHRVQGEPDDLVRRAVAARRLLQSPITVSATATSGLPVTFASTTSVDLHERRHQRCHDHASSVPGTCNVRATQPGNAIYNAAPAINRSFTVTKVSQTISFAALANKTLADSPITVARPPRRDCR